MLFVVEMIFEEILFSIKKIDWLDFDLNYFLAIYFFDRNISNLNDHEGILLRPNYYSKFFHQEQKQFLFLFEPIVWPPLPPPSLLSRTEIVSIVRLGDLNWTTVVLVKCFDSLLQFAIDFTVSPFMKESLETSIHCNWK